MAPTLPGQSSSSRAAPPSADDGATAFQRRVDGVFDEMLAGLMECSQRARYHIMQASSARMEEALVALKTAEAALKGVTAELHAERERSWKAAVEADVAAARAEGRIAGLKDTVRLSATRIVELEKRLDAHVARANRLEGQAARVPMLEARIAGLVEVEAEVLKRARKAPGAGPSK